VKVGSVGSRGQKNNEPWVKDSGFEGETVKLSWTLVSSAMVAQGYGTYGVELNDWKGCSAAVAFSL
jgi:hypothetical protein